MGFDALTAEKIGHYVYALVDPRQHLTDSRTGEIIANSKVPFYIGKGVENRVFEHVACALKEPTENDKYDLIREIRGSGKDVEHYILRHGLNSREATEVEATLIDFARMTGLPVVNVAGGYHSGSVGYMSTDEVIQMNNAPPLTELSEGHVIININKTYEKASGPDAIYDATRASWVISKRRISTIDHVLSEYRGIIREVFKVAEWYPVPAHDRSGKPTTRWAFSGEVAEPSIREKYRNRAISKKRGDRHSVRFKL